MNPCGLKKPLISGLSSAQLLEGRAQRFRNLGVFEELA